MTRYLYLHGFASSPQSMKAQTLQAHFHKLGLPLEIPDLNQGDFAGLTLGRQIDQVKALILQDQAPVVLIGSSLGGLTAAWLAEQPELQDRLTHLVLMAPAFRFLEQWLPRLGEGQHQRWQGEGVLPVYHHGEQCPLPLRYSFIEDAQQYDDSQLHQPIPTLILHGRQDDVIALQASLDYAAQRPWVTLVALESDHTLASVQQEIWQNLRSFLQL